MSSKPQHTCKDLRAMTNEDLAWLLSGVKERTGEAFLIDMEIRRRQNAANELRGWIALGVSVLAVVVALFSMFRHQ